MRLIKGDCLEVMDKLIEEGVKVDAVITDPPYGIDFQSQWKKNKEDWKPKILNDKKPFIEFIEKIERTLSEKGVVMIFTRWDVQQQFIDELNKIESLKIKNIIIWNKVIHGMGDLKRAYGSKYESIIYATKKGFKFPGKRPTDILEYKRVNANKLIHPNEKPIELLEKLINDVTFENDVVLDCFMGSGTTGVACKNTNRKFIGIELDDNYFNIAKERITGGD